jgi:hypothetical protein
LSQIVLAHALRQASVSLIFDVRQKKMISTDLPRDIRSCLAELESNGVSGARELKAKIDRCEACSKDFRQRENLWTEGFAVFFARESLGLEVLRIEQSNDIPSPFRRKERSCDILCRSSDGESVYIETKDMSVDLLRGQRAGLHGYTPQTQEELAHWFSNRVWDCIEKGATLMISRIPVYSPAWQPIQEEDIHFELFRDHAPREELPVRISEMIPRHLKGVWIIKNGAQVFYRFKNET